MKDCCKNGVPTLEEAMLILKDAEKLNPGNWVNHSMFVAEFRYNDEVVIIGKWDGTIEQYNFVKDYLLHIEENDYDKLIKLCDSLSLPNGFVLIEKRLVEMALRGGLNEYTIPRWKSTFEIKQYFENKMGKSVYDILPGVIDNTFNS